MAEADLSFLATNAGVTVNEFGLTVVANIPVMAYTTDDGQEWILRPGQVLPFNCGHEFCAHWYKLEYRRYQLMLYRDRDIDGRLRYPDKSHELSEASWLKNGKVVTVPDGIVGHLGSGFSKPLGMGEDEFYEWINAMDYLDVVASNDRIKDLIPVFYWSEDFSEIQVDEWVFDMLSLQPFQVQRMEHQVWMLDKLPSKKGGIPDNWSDVCKAASSEMQFLTADRRVFIGLPNPSSKFLSEDQLCRDRQTLAEYKTSAGIKPVCVPFPMADKSKDNDRCDIGNETLVWASILNAPAEVRLNSLLIGAGLPRIQLRYD